MLLIHILIIWDNILVGLGWVKPFCSVGTQTLVIYKNKKELGNPGCGWRVRWRDWKVDQEEPWNVRTTEGTMEQILPRENGGVAHRKGMVH